MRFESSVFAWRRTTANAAVARYRRVALVLLVAGSGSWTRASAQAWPVRGDTIRRDTTGRNVLRRDSARVAMDSLTARLERAEAELELLRRQVATEASTNVRTRSRLQVELSARILVNGFMSRGALNSADVPTFATNDPPPAALSAASPSRIVGLSLRQSRIGLSMFVDSVMGGTFEGDVDVDFFGGGAAAASEAYSFPQPRLRTARFVQHWARTELLVGAESPLISDLSPVTVASVGVPGFSEAGNLWNWLPQVRVTRELGVTAVGNASLHWALQGAVLHPFTGIQLAGDEYGVDAGERSGRPYLQSRVRARWGRDGSDGGTSGESKNGGELGVAVHRGWLRVGGDTLTSSYATSADARVGLPRELELRGEIYSGRALAGLGGGGIDQNFGIARNGAAFGSPLRDVGGWAQLNWRAHATVLTGAGCGIDAANVNDNPERQRNRSCAVHAMWRPAQPLVFGVELRNLKTTYATRAIKGTHLNFSFGFEL